MADIAFLTDTFAEDGLVGADRLCAMQKYGYPPNLADEAVQTVLAQAEILLRET